DGARIEVVGEWSSSHFEDSYFAELGPEEPHDFRYRHHRRRCFGRLWIRVRARVEALDVAARGRRRGLLHAESIDVLEEIRRDETRVPPPGPRETGWEFIQRGLLCAVDHLPAYTADGMVRDSDGTRLELV